MNWSRRKVAVTGGLGFIGSHLVEALLKKGASVVVVDDSRIRPHLYQSKLLSYMGICKACGVTPQFQDMDLQFSAQSFREVARKVDVVFHLAAYFGGRGFVEQQQSECSAMFAVDQNVFRIASEEGVQHLHYASSACVYPNSLQHDRGYLLREEDAIPQRGWESADNIYGWAKLMGERQIQILHNERGLSTSTCRFLTVYGPREYDDSHAIAALINRTLRSEDPFVVWGDGLQERGFTFVTDIVSGVLRASEVVTDGTPLNLGVDWRVNMKRVVQLIHQYLEFKPSNVIYDTTKPVGPVSRALNIQRTRETIGWVPQVGIEEGLKSTVAWHKDNNPLLKT